MIAASRRVCAALDGGVAVAAVDAEDGDVVLMAERHRLCDRLAHAAPPRGAVEKPEERDEEEEGRRAGDDRGVEEEAGRS
jgi:hypothetical protein